MLLKIKLKLNNGETKQHIAEDVRRTNDKLMVLLPSGEAIHYNWDNVSHYESKKVNETTLESMNE